MRRHAAMPPCRDGKMSSTSRPTPRCAASWSAAWLKALATPDRRHSGRDKAALEHHRAGVVRHQGNASHRVIGLVRDEVGVEHRRRIRRLAPHQRPHVLRASRRIGTTSTAVSRWLWNKRSAASLQCSRLWATRTSTPFSLPPLHCVGHGRAVAGGARTWPTEWAGLRRTDSGAGGHDPPGDQRARRCLAPRLRCDDLAYADERPYRPLGTRQPNDQAVVGVHREPLEPGRTSMAMPSRWQTSSRCGSAVPRDWSRARATSAATQSARLTGQLVRW